MAKVISFVQEKGGAGKSTLLCCLAALLKAREANVAIIDTDPNGDSHSWAMSNQVNIDALSLLSDSKLAPTIRKLKETYDVILIDTAGYKSSMSTFALGHSDMVIIPCNGGANDVQKAKNTHMHIKTTEDNLGKSIQHRVVFVGAQKATNSTKSAKTEFEQMNGVAVLKAGLWYVDSLKEFFKKTTIPKGRANTFSNEVLGDLQIEGVLPSFFKAALLEVNNG